jgi:plastocyanin
MNRRTPFLFSALFLALPACNSGGSASAPAAPAAAIANPVDPATAATVSGQVTYTGPKVEPKKIVMSGDAYCKTHHAGVVDSPEIIVNPNGTLKNVYVYVKSGLEGKKFPVPTQPAVLNQKDCLYEPHVLALQAGQELVIRNSDGVLHNVNARPKINQGFNVGQPVQGMEAKKSFDKPEIGIPVKCDVHPWMVGFINVQDHPFAAVTGDDGAFSLKDLPPGTYTLEAWHEKFGTAQQTVTVGPKERATVTFTFKG